MSLPPPPRKKSEAPAPSMLDKNREVEDQQARAEALALPALPEVPMGKVTFSPVAQDSLDLFDEAYRQLRKQRRSLKRYQLADALLASLEDPEVMAAVVKRLS